MQNLAVKSTLFCHFLPVCCVRKVSCLRFSATWISRRTLRLLGYYKARGRTKSSESLIVIGSFAVPVSKGLQTTVLCSQVCVSVLILRLSGSYLEAIIRRLRASLRSGESSASSLDWNTLSNCLFQVSTHASSSRVPCRAGTRKADGYACHKRIQVFPSTCLLGLPLFSLAALHDSWRQL